MGYAATNNFVVAPGVLIHLFERGKCVEVWQLIDNARFLAAIGAMPKLPRSQADAATTAGG